MTATSRLQKLRQNDAHNPAEVDGYCRFLGENDEDNDSDQDGAPLKVNDLRRRTGMNSRCYEGTKAIMVE